MKKKLLSLLLATGMVMSLVACGGGEKPADDKAAEIAQKLMRGRQRVAEQNGENNTSIFRLSGILKEEIEPLILKKAVDIVLKDYKGFKVKTGSGLFWNYLEYNYRKPKIKIEEGIPCKHINFRKNS